LEAEMQSRSVVRSQQALGQELARLRYDRELTQGELADELGINRRYIHEIESGKPNLFATRLFELLRELGAHLEVVSDRPSADPDPARE
jgi:HTH-type transcriptional regulator/antitoxin HipB